MNCAPSELPSRQDLPGVGRNLHDHLLSGGNVYRARRPVLGLALSALGIPDVHRATRRLGAPEMVLACVVLPVTTEQFTGPPMGEGYTLMFGFTHPRSRGSVRLASADPAAPPLIDPNYLAEEYDRETYLAALEAAQIGRINAGAWPSGARRKCCPVPASRSQIRAAGLPGEGRLHPPSSRRHLPHGHD